MSLIDFSPQLGSHDCLLCVAAMLTGEDRKRLELETAYIEPSTEFFPLSEFFAVLGRYGLWPVPALPPLEVEPGADGVKRYPGAAVEICAAVGCHVPLEGTPALIAVERFGGGLHALAWDGERLLDPGRPRAENPVAWHGYKILAVYPFTDKPMGGDPR